MYIYIERMYYFSQVSTCKNTLLVLLADYARDITLILLHRKKEKTRRAFHTNLIFQLSQ